MAAMINQSEIENTLDVTEQILRWLGQAKAYKEKTTAIERVETHISIVFLTDRFAYKLKKPVKFDFLDFSSLEQRRLACLEEVRINKRLAPNVYLGVVPITRHKSNGFQLGGGGEAVEYAVKMRRLSASQSLDRLIQSHQLKPQQVEALSQRLRTFYSMTPILSLKTDDYRTNIERHVIANRKSLLSPEDGLDGAQVKLATAAQIQFLHIMPDLLDLRVCDGRIVEGHGDLRAEHIYFAPDPVVIDGIEFNAEFRQVDVLDELSFLAMECDALDSPDVGRRIIADYCLSSNDHPFESLLAFYKSYRACVRAKVAAMRARQLTGTDQLRSRDVAVAYLSLAARYANELSPPLLLMVWGLSGTGKSVLSKELTEQLGCDLLQTDAVRRELFAESEPRGDYDAGDYTVANRNLVYAELLRRAERLIVHGISAVIDGTFLAPDQRQRAAQLAKKHGAIFLSIRCECPDDVAMNRIRERAAAGNSLSQIKPEHFQRQQKQLEEDTPSVRSVKVNTLVSLPTMNEQVFSAIRALLPPSGRL